MVLECLLKCVRKPRASCVAIGLWTHFLVLVQKLQNICKYSLKLGHTDTITLKKGRDQYGKALFYAGRP